MSRLRRPIVALAAVGLTAIGLALIGLAPSGVASTSGRPSAGGLAAATPPCGRTRIPAHYRHVVWIVMETYSYRDIIGSSSAPYLNQLASDCGVASDYDAVAHPSLPNYLALTSGSTHGITDDEEPRSHPIASANIFSQLGGNWRTYVESMPSTCDKVTSGQYAARHNPAVYYTDLGRQCPAQDVPLGKAPAITAAFTVIIPNICDDMHSCPVSVGDAWIGKHLPPLLTSPTYRSGSTVVFIVWDEADSQSMNHVATIVVGPSVPKGIRVATPFSHYSTLRTTESLLGLPLLANATSANSMVAGFHL